MALFSTNTKLLTLNIDIKKEFFTSPLNLRHDELSHNKDANSCSLIVRTKLTAFLFLGTTPIKALKKANIIYLRRL